MSSIERLDSAEADPDVGDDTVIVITEPIFRSLALLRDDIATVKVEAGLPKAVDVIESEELENPVTVTELPPLVNDMAIFPTDTLLLRLLKVIL